MCCSSSGGTGAGRNNRTGQECRTVNSEKKLKSLEEILLWGRLTQGKDVFLQHIAEANIGSVIYALVDLGCSASQREENAHCWHNDSLRI